jgi:putative acetyltransferase
LAATTPDKETMRAFSTSRQLNSKIRPSRRSDGDRVVDIWRAAVDTTHHFLTADDRQAIDLQVQQFLPYSALWLAVDPQDQAIGFMGLAGPHVDALFIDPAFHGIGVGRQLVSLALRFHPVITTDVNEQNPRAIGFYERLGFVGFGRSPIDDHGRPYPLLHLRLDSRR